MNEECKECKRLEDGLHRLRDEIDSLPLQEFERSFLRVTSILREHYIENHSRDLEVGFRGPAFDEPI